MSSQGRAELDRVLEGGEGAEYDEEVFRYFLSLEQARAARARYPLRLLFASVEPVPGKPVPIRVESAATLFDGLKGTLRETDVTGWYRKDRIAGAVLSACADAPGTGTSTVIERRVRDNLRQRLPPDVARSLRVRIMQFGPRQVGTA